MEEEGNLSNNGQGDAKDILSCIDTEETIVIDDEYPEQKVTIGRQLTTMIKMRLRDILRVHADVFAWTTTHITGVPRTLIIGEETFSTKHQLNVFNHTEPVKQKKRSLAPERNELVCTQVKELVEAGVLREIPIAEKDEERTTFFTREGVFCYRRLPFGLKNAGATYQRLIDKVFDSQIGRNIEVNADDMVIKSDSEEEMLAHIEETLGRLWAINLKLNKKMLFRSRKRNIFWSSNYEASPKQIPLEKHREGPPFHENTRKLDEWKDGLADNKSKRSLSKNERMLRVTTNNGYTKQRGKKQAPVYFVSRTLNEAEQKYPELEKLILALVYAAKKIQRYFQAHPIQVLSDMPIKQVLAKPEKLGRVAKWAIELGEHGIEFKGRNSIKGQILADFLAETSPKEPEPENTWKLFTDGASSFDGPGAGLMIVNLKGKEYTYALRQQTIKQYQKKAMGLLSSFPNYSIEHIKREQNKKADALGKLASITFSKLAKEVLVEGGVLPKDPQKARKLRIKAPLYRMIEERLYRRSYMSPWLRYVGPMQAKSIIKEVHEGSCGMHSSPRSVVSQIIILGYYWPSMHKDAKELIHKCEACQIYSLVPRKPKQEMTSIMSAWPFSQWGIHIVGPLPTTPVGARFGRPQIIISDNGKQFTEGTFPVFYKKLGAL
ncbi:reverse transcriptase domain-containing protein [Tanacetum coccineum]